MKRIKRISLLVVVLLLLAGSLVQASAASRTSFTDVKQGTWYYDNVIRLAESGSISGYPDGSFKPNSQITKGEFTKILVSQMGYEASKVTNKHWAHGYIEMAIELGLAEDYELENPNEHMPRALMAKMINYADDMNSVDLILSYGKDLNFKDMVGNTYSLNRVYRNDIKSAVKKGLLAGYTDNTFKGEKGLTRAEASAVIIRLIDESERLDTDVKYYRSDQVNQIRLGLSEKEVIKLLGQPSRIDVSVESFNWYVYNHDISKFLMVGIDRNEVAALYTTSPEWSINGLRVGDRFPEAILGANPYDSSDNTILFNNEMVRLNVFLDSHSNNSISSLLLYRTSNPYRSRSYYEDNEELIKAYELQMIDINNAYRERFGLGLLEENNSLNRAARGHSKDMATKNYFAHDSLNGDRFSDRIRREGFRGNSRGENIAAGYPNAMSAMNGLFNSPGHRANILFDGYSFIGTGVDFKLDSTYHMYYTQNFGG